MGIVINRKWLSVVGGALVGVACGQNFDDDTTAGEYGSFEQPLVTSSGKLSCSSPKKQLICHIPPGNPANAHSICIGKPAVAPHVSHHHDLIGPCDPADAAPGTGGSTGTGGGNSLPVPPNDCPDDPSDDPDEHSGNHGGTGGAAGTGGASGTGGSTATGGAAGTGGSGDTGGSSGTGGGDEPIEGPGTP